MAMTFAYDDGTDNLGTRRGVRKVICSWTCDGSGDASGTTGKLVGALVKASTNPTDSPTDNYDITLADEDGIDILAACQSSLLNRDVTNSEEVYFFVKDAAGTPLAQPVHPVVCGALTVTVAAAGNTKSGVLNLYLRG
jgi:hypothetical protein